MKNSKWDDDLNTVALDFLFSANDFKLDSTVHRGSNHF